MNELLSQFNQLDPRAILVVVALIAVAYVVFTKQSKKSDGGTASDPNDPNSWEIGPVISGKNLSHNVPLHPVSTAEGLQIVMPTSDGVHYFTKPTTPLANRNKLVAKLRINADPGVKFVPSSDPNAPPLISLYFQRLGDDWTAQGEMEAYRWYASFATLTNFGPGDYTIEAPLDANWTAILTSSRANNPQGFQAALDSTGRVGIVFGGGTGLGHGMYATGPASITLLSFDIV